jgi:hypothetical protein
MLLSCLTASVAAAAKSESVEAQESCLSLSLRREPDTRFAVAVARRLLAAEHSSWDSGPSAGLRRGQSIAVEEGTVLGFRRRALPIRCP